MKTAIVLLLALSLVACGDDGGSQDGSGGVEVSGDNNEVFVVDGQFEDCSGVIFRFVSYMRDSTQESTICADGQNDDENCSDCFDDEYLINNGYKSNEGCVEDRVLKGECGSEQLIAQAQEAARQ